MTSPQNFKQQPARYPELDALRGVAVLSVLLYHYTIAYKFHFKLNSAHDFKFTYGYLAVELFFMISGFVIFLTIGNSKRKTDFLVSRFSRLYPAYWAAICLTLAIITLFPVPTLGNYSLKAIILNFTMFQGFDKHIRLIDQVYWTLKFELTFYIIIYLFYITHNLKRITYLCFPWLLLSLVSFFFKIPGKKYLDVLLILEYAPLFIAGINFYRLKIDKNDKIAHILVAISLLVELPWINKYDLGESNYAVVIIILLSFYILFYLFIYRGLPWLNTRVLLFFGSISYTLYLLHNVIGYALIYRLRAVCDLQIFYIPVTFVFVVSLATFVSYFIEEPAIKYIRQWYKVKSIIPPNDINNS